MSDSVRALLDSSPIAVENAAYVESPAGALGVESELFRELGRSLAVGMVLWAPVSDGARTDSMSWSYREGIYASKLPWRVRLGWRPVTFAIDLSHAEAATFAFEFHAESPVEVSHAKLVHLSTPAHDADAAVLPGVGAARLPDQDGRDPRRAGVHLRGVRGARAEARLDPA